MKSHILTLTIKSIKDEKESFTDHYEVFCDEDENGITTYQQAKNRLDSLEMEYETENTEAEIWASNISLIVETSEHYSIEKDNFPNDRVGWLETHFQVVNFITLDADLKTNEPSVIKNVNGELGHSGLMQLSIDWTQEFEAKYAGISWGETETDLDYYDSIDAFLIEKNKL